jgi:DNA (cytosine-5)-methyltransferase 1
MKVVSLFAGVGGFDLAAQRAGFEIVGQVEIDKKCQEVLRRRFPEALLHDDVTTATQWAKENDLIGQVDIVCGGFPCQDVSVAGKRAGISGERSGLFYDAIQFAREVKAHTIILENVPGLLSSNEGRDFGVVIFEMADAGYSHIEWRVLDSQFFGVPQRRRRVFIIGSSRNPSGTPILIEREGLRGDTAKSKSQGESSTTSTLRSFGQTGFAKYSEGVTTLTATTYKRPEDNVVVHQK